MTNKNASPNHKNVSGNVAAIFFCHVLPESTVMVSLFKRVSYTAHTIPSIAACSSTHSPLPHCINICAWVRTQTFQTEKRSRNKKVPWTRTKKQILVSLQTIYHQLHLNLNSGHQTMTSLKNSGWPLIAHLCVCYNNSGESLPLIQRVAA